MLDFVGGSKANSAPPTGQSSISLMSFRRTVRSRTCYAMRDSAFPEHCGFEESMISSN